MVPEDVTATSLVGIDDEVVLTAPEISQADIVAMVRDDANEESEDEIEEIAEEMVGIVYVETAFDVLKDNAMYSEEGLEMNKLISQLESLYENERFRSLRQGDIRDFFH